MSGIINSAPTKDAGSRLNNPLLQEAEDKVYSQLEPETKQNVDKIIVAGMAAALDKGPNGILASLKQSKDPISDAAKGAVALVQVLRKDAKGVMPMKAFVPASNILMLRALDFADRGGIVKVGNEELVRATHIWTDTIFGQMGVTKEGLARVGEKVYALTQSPEAMAKINEKAGVTRHPNAAPTQTPPA